MLNIVVSCTYRKRNVGLAAGLPTDQCARLREVQGTMSERAKVWRGQLRSQALPGMKARDLYAGEHWAISLELPAIAAKRGIETQLWVCSAGYGLVSADTVLKPYSATFSPGPDSVHHPEVDDCNPSQANEDWWGHLGKWKFRQGLPRTLSDLHATHPGSRLLVVASERYMRAFRSDLSKGCLDDPDRVLLISAGYPATDKLAPLLLPADARFQSEMGGVRQALNARLARGVLKDLSSDDGFQRIRARFRRKLARAPALPSYDRAPLRDDEVRQFLKKEIRQLRRARGKAHHTPLLRKLRDAGRACEQSRFRRLFHEVENELDA